MHQLAAIVDTETTGTANQDQLIELAIILFEFNPTTGQPLTIIDSYTGLREPTVPIHPGASKVHGLTPQNLAGHTLDTAKIKSIFTQATFIIAHNATFDKRFITKLFPYTTQKTWLCSMNGIPWKKLGYPSKGLEKLLHAHSVPITQEHRALADVEHVYNLLSLTNQTTGHPYLHTLINTTTIPPTTSHSTPRLKPKNKKPTNWLKIALIIGAILTVLILCLCACSIALALTDPTTIPQTLPPIQ